MFDVEMLIEFGLLYYLGCCIYATSVTVSTYIRLRDAPCVRDDLSDFGTEVLNNTYAFYSKPYCCDGLLHDSCAIITERTEANRFRQFVLVRGSLAGHPEYENIHLHALEVPTGNMSGRTTLVLRVSKTAGMHFVSWWVFLRGTKLDWESILSFVLFYSIFLPAMLLAHVVFKTPSLRSRLNLYPVSGSLWLSVDFLPTVRAIDKIVVEALLVVLEKRDIDTSDLRNYRSQSININVAGGKAMFGNITQGSSNVATSQVGGIGGKR